MAACSPRYAASRFQVNRRPESYCPSAEKRNGQGRPTGKCGVKMTPAHRGVLAGNSWWTGGFPQVDSSPPGVSMHDCQKSSILGALNTRIRARENLLMERQGILVLRGEVGHEHFPSREAAAE